MVPVRPLAPGAPTVGVGEGNDNGRYHSLYAGDLEVIPGPLPAGGTDLSLARYQTHTSICGF